MENKNDDHMDYQLSNTLWAITENIKVTMTIKITMKINQDQYEDQDEKARTRELAKEELWKESDESSEHESSILVFRWSQWQS